MRYTDLYNAVYQAIKTVRPDAAVGGFYLAVTGDAANTLGYSGRDTETPMIRRDLDCLEYWLKHNAGADFLVVDRWLAGWNDQNRISETNQLALTWTYQTVLQAIRAKSSLPLWYGEYYTARYDAGALQFDACAEASIYLWMNRGAGATPVTALLWNPSEGESEVTHPLFTRTATPDGGQPTPHYSVFKWFHDYFGPGTPLCQAISSDPEIEVLASPAKTLLINKRNSAQTVTVNGTAFFMPAYGVLLLDTPSKLFKP